MSRTPKFSNLPAQELGHVGEELPLSKLLDASSEPRPAQGRRPVTGQRGSVRGEKGGGQAGLASLFSEGLFFWSGWGLCFGSCYGVHRRSRSRDRKGVWYPGCSGSSGAVAEVCRFNRFCFGEFSKFGFWSLKAYSAPAGRSQEKTSLGVSAALHIYR